MRSIHYDGSRCLASCECVNRKLERALELNAELAGALTNYHRQITASLSYSNFTEGMHAAEGALKKAGARTGSPVGELCGVESRTVGPCDLPKGHKGRLHSSGGDGFFSE